MSVTGLFVALVPGMVFTVMSIADCSMGQMVLNGGLDHNFVKNYLEWRAEAPVFVRHFTLLPQFLQRWQFS